MLMLMNRRPIFIAALWDNYKYTVNENGTKKNLKWDYNFGGFFGVKKPYLVRYKKDLYLRFFLKTLSNGFKRAPFMVCFYKNLGKWFFNKAPFLVCS